jgi:hypothetical protein
LTGPGCDITIAVRDRLQAIGGIIGGHHLPDKSIVLIVSVSPAEFSANFFR